MGQTVLRNVTLATMVEDARPYGMLRNAVVGFRDGIITLLEPNFSRSSIDEDATLVDCDGMILTPGLIDCHTHLVYAGERSAEFSERISGRTYVELAAQGRGIQATVSKTRLSDAEALCRESGPRLEALMEEGVTTVEIKTGYGLDIASEMKMLNVACKLEKRYPVDVHKTFLGAHAVPAEMHGDADAYIHHVCTEMLPELNDTGQLDSVDAFCETVGFSVNQVRRVFTAAQNCGLPVRLHAEQLSDSGGARMAAEVGALSVDHLEYLDPPDAACLADRETTAVLLPGAFYYLGESRKPPVEALRANGVEIAVATDCNPGSSPLCSLLTAMNMACVLFGLTPEEALAGVTRNAARALGEGNSKGTIEVGKRADLVLWEIRDPAELSYRLGENRCRRVWVDGVERA